MSQTENRTVLLVESDRSTARQIQDCLANAGFTVLRPVRTSREALATVADTEPDIIVLDLGPPIDTAALDELSSLAVSRGLPLVCLSGLTDRATLELAADAHAAALVLKPINDRQLASTVTLVAMTAERNTALPKTAPRMTAEEKLRMIAAVVNDEPLERRAGPPRRTEPPLAQVGQESLSAREREVVELLANGARVVTIARQLELSPHTVRNHLKSVFRKLNLHGQHELFEYWRGQRTV